MEQEVKKYFEEFKSKLEALEDRMGDIAYKAKGSNENIERSLKELKDELRSLERKIESLEQKISK